VPERPIGIVSADPSEAAAVLKLMHVTHTRTVNGYTYSIGTLDGHPVVDVAAGEMTDTTVLATWTLDTTFHPRATLWTGTAGADIARIHVGDVVIGGFITDKYDLFLQRADEVPGATTTSQVSLGGIELHTTPPADTAGDIVTFRPDATHIFVSQMAGSEQLAELAARAPTGTTTIATATGNPNLTGTIKNKVVLGVAGQCSCFTDPLEEIAAQNAVQPNDSESEEDPGFAWANQEAGIPFLDIRAISDTPWEKVDFTVTGPLADQRGAAVVRFVIDHLPPGPVSKVPVTFADLSPGSAARQAGYLDGRAFYDVTPVSRIDYTAQDGTKVTLTGASLAAFLAQYQLGQDGLP
jgi:adenosylhomocysteine nucleosidase